MTQKNIPGYPLPSGELGEDEIVCQLIYLPNRPEYWQALLASVHYLSTWRAWDRDADKRGKDAASNWRAAFELTIGCWRMTCLEELTATVTDILELLQTRKDCCDDNITYLPVDPITTDIVPDEGDPPDFYGETAVSDWPDWEEHVCYNAHKYVDYLAHAGDQLYIAVENNSIFLGLIAALLTLLSFSGIGLPIAFGLAAAVVAGLALGGTIVTFEETEASIEASRDLIVCAILRNSGLGEAVETALSSGLDWDLFYQFIPYESALATIYEGGIGTEYLPTETRDDCFCEEELLVYGVGGDQATCITFNKTGSYRFPPTGYANSWTTYQHSLTCNDLGYLGSVLRCRLFDSEDAAKGKKVEAWVSNHSVEGGMDPGWPMVDMQNTASQVIFEVSQGEFVEGEHYVVENVWTMEVFCGENGSATLNWKYLD